MLNTMLALFEGLTPMNGKNMTASLEILWKGLLAIFIVIFAIIIVVKLTALTIAKCEEAKKKKAEEQKSNDENSN
ncbi:MAG: hypothetical protein IJY21_03435 [Clostridia bacterium]|nr:hypothetical protein [Clostridia bacterium]